MRECVRVPMSNQLVQLLNQPLHVLLPLLDVATDLVEVHLLNLELLSRGDTLEHLTQGHVNLVHPDHHAAEPDRMHRSIARTSTSASISASASTSKIQNPT